MKDLDHCRSNVKIGTNTVSVIIDHDGFQFGLSFPLFTYDKAKLELLLHSAQAQIELILDT